MASPTSSSVLFVCLGNICRSPTGEAVFRAIAEQKTANSSDTTDAPPTLRIDSCGTGGGSANWYRPNGFAFHEGEKSDARMTREAKKRGYRLMSRARSLTPSDIKEFDYIVCMEEKNRVAVLEAAKAWGGDACKQLAAQKVRTYASVRALRSVSEATRVFRDQRTSTDSVVALDRSLSLSRIVVSDVL